MLEDYKYKDLNLDIAFLEKEKDRHWSMFNAVQDMLRLIDNAYNQDDLNKNTVLNTLKNRSRELSRLLDDIDEKLTNLKKECNHKWKDVSEPYDNYTVFKCKICGSYKKEA